VGRKGVSKRKQGKVKSKTVAGGVSSGSVSSLVQTADSQSGRSMDVGKNSTSTQGSGKNSENRMKPSKK
jgi:hypothetical protein